jgi:hypothetical protein
MSGSTSNINVTEGSSLRVRLRMIAHQSSCVRARISSTGSSGGSSILVPNNTTTTSMRSSSVYHNKNCIILNGSSRPLLFDNKSTSNNNLSSVSHNLRYQQRRLNEQVLCLYDPKMSVSYQNLSQQQSIPIRIGINEKETGYTKTFRLTENLQSNIRFDVTLKPSMSIRDNRLDPSAAAAAAAAAAICFNSNSSKINFPNFSSHELAAHTTATTSSSMHDPYSRSSSYDAVGGGSGSGSGGASSGSHGSDNNSGIDLHVVKKIESAKATTGSGNSSSHKTQPLDTSDHCVPGDEDEDCEEHQIDLPIDSTLCDSNFRVSREQVTQLPYRTNVPLNSSITFKIRNLNLHGGSGSSDSYSSKKQSSSSNLETSNASSSASSGHSVNNVSINKVMNESFTRSGNKQQSSPSSSASLNLNVHCGSSDKNNRHRQQQATPSSQNGLGNPFAFIETFSARKNSPGGLLSPADAKNRVFIRHPFIFVISSF